MSWTLAPSLIKLRAEVDAKWPARSKKYDGTVGDSAHQARKSEHNPNSNPNDSVPNGMVTAMDITVETAVVRKALLALLIGDPRVWYCIHQGFIYSRTHGWAKNPYDGDPHAHHLHVSLVQSRDACTTTAKWFAPAAAPVKPEPRPVKKYPTLERGDSDPVLVPFLKRYFGLAHINENELFGSGTEAKVKEFQRRHKLAVDGVVGLKTWAAIKAGGTLLPPGWTL